MAGYVAESAKTGRPFPARIPFLFHLLLHSLGGERLPGHGFLSSVALESDSLSLICLSHMKVLEHL